jgi:hypothetical protein
VTGWRALPLLLLLTACAGGPWERNAGTPRSAAPPDDTQELVSQAEALAHAGSHAQAVAIFEEVAKNPSSAFVDRALLGLAKSLCNPDYAGHDYRLAFVMADRLVREYPDSRQAVEGRAWRDLLLGYLSRGQEIDRRAMELKEILTEQAREKEELERLRRVDLELERRTRELQWRTQELERLKRLDLELEKRKRKPAAPGQPPDRQ